MGTEESGRRVTYSYIISFDYGRPSSITHLGCGRTSYNRNDIDHHYCGHCKIFMDIFAFESGQGIVPLLRDALSWPTDDE